MASDAVVLKDDRLKIQRNSAFKDTVTAYHKQLGEWDSEAFDEKVSLSLELKKEKKGFFSSTKRWIIVTDAGVYVFTNGKCKEKNLERRIDLKQIKSVLLEKSTHKFVLHLWKEHDCVYECSNAKDRKAIARHICSRAFAKTQRAPEEVELTGPEIAVVFKTKEDVAAKQKAEEDEKAVTKRASVFVAARLDDVDATTHTSRADTGAKDGLSDVGVRLRKLLRDLDASVPSPMRRYFTYLNGWPKKTDCELARIVCELVSSPGGRKLLVKHCLDSSTSFTFLRSLVDCLAACLASRADPELRRWATISLYRIRQILSSDGDNDADVANARAKRKRMRAKSRRSSGEDGLDDEETFELAAELRGHVLGGEDQSTTAGALLTLDFPVFFATHRGFKSPFDAVDYNALLEIALGRVVTPKKMGDKAVTAEEKIEPWNAPIDVDGGCELLELGLRLVSCRKLERVQECITDWFVLLMRSAANMRTVLLEDGWPRFVLPVFTRVPRDKDNRDTTHKDVLNKAAALYAKLLCFSFDQGNQKVFEAHMTSLFDEITSFNGWAGDAGQVVRIICYKLIGTLKKDAGKWASDILDPHWNSVFALCETLEEMIFRRPYAAAEHAYTETRQCKIGSNVGLLRMYGVQIDVDDKDEDAIVDDEVLFTQTPLLRLKPEKGFVAPIPGADVHLSGTGDCVDARLAEFVLQLLTKTLGCTGEVGAAKRGRTRAEKQNWEFAEQLALSFRRMVEIFKTIKKEQKGKRGVDVMTLSEDAMKLVTEWCYERAKRKSTGFFSFFGGPSKTDIAVELRECQLHRKAHYTIAVATKKRANQIKTGEFKCPKSLQTPAARRKVKNDVLASSRTVKFKMKSRRGEGSGGGGDGATKEDTKSPSPGPKCRIVPDDDAEPAVVKSAACKGCATVAPLDDMAEIEDDYWHPQCFTCETCNKGLITRKKSDGDEDELSYDSQYFIRDDKRWCRSCFVGKYAKHTCASCLEPLMPDVSPVSACGKLWHPEHFTCTNCAVNLGDGTVDYIEEEGDPYCETCFEVLFRTCPGCSKVIENSELGKCLKAPPIPGTWHRECFRCHSCDVKLDEHYYDHEVDGKIRPFCRKDYERLFLVKCTKCQLPITEQYFHNLGQAWHRDCWRCTECDCSLQDGYVMHLGAPYCAKDYARLFAPRCEHCKKPIYDPDGKEGAASMINVNGKTYHVDCYTCDTCGLPIKGKVWHPDDGTKMCDSCWEEASPECAVCKKKVLRAIGTVYGKVHDRWYHGECMKCCVAACCLTDDLVPDEAGCLYCPEHVPTHEDGDVCAACGKILKISDDVVESKAGKYHAACFVCYMCGKPARGGHDGKLFCGKQCMMDDYNGVAPKEGCGGNAASVTKTAEEDEGPSSGICAICGKSWSRDGAARLQKWNGAMYHYDCVNKCGSCGGSFDQLCFMNGRMYCDGCKDRVLRGDVVAPPAPAVDAVGEARTAAVGAESPKTAMKIKKKKKKKKTKSKKKEIEAQARGDGIDRAKYPAIDYQDVVNRSGLPEGYDKQHKEMYLTEDDFEEVFKMHRKDFMKLKPWKQAELKKGVNLF